jgi:hypothetical protein
MSQHCGSRLRRASGARPAGDSPALTGENRRLVVDVKKFDDRLLLHRLRRPQLHQKGIEVLHSRL